MTPADLDVDPDALRLGGLIAWAERELDELRAVLAVATDAQWTAPPVARPKEDTAERAKNSRSDPTGTLAADDDRLCLRAQVIRSETVIRNAIIAARGVRRGLEHALAPWTEDRT